MLNQLHRIRDEFSSGLEGNLEDFEPEYCFPEFRLPLRARVLPWRPRVKELLREALGTNGAVVSFDLSQPWCRKLAQGHFAPGVSREVLSVSNCFRIYELLGISVRFRVAAIFLTAWAEGGLAPTLPHGWLSAAQEMLWEFEEQAVASRPAAATISVIGTAVHVDEALVPSSHYRNLQFFCLAAPTGGSWRFRLPDLGGCRGWFGFARHLLPLGRNRRFEWIRRELKVILEEQRLSATAARLAERLGWPEGVVALDLEELRRAGEMRRIITRTGLAAWEPCGPQPLHHA